MINKIIITLPLSKGSRSLDSNGQVTWYTPHARDTERDKVAEFMECKNRFYGFESCYHIQGRCVAAETNQLGSVEEWSSGNL